VIVDVSIRNALPTFLSYYSEPEDSPENLAFAGDADGHVFINYLHAPIGLDYTPDRTGQLLDRHKERVVNALAEHRHTRRVRRKYLWVAAYHNWFCSTWLDAKSAKELVIPHVRKRAFVQLVEWARL